MKKREKIVTQAIANEKLEGLKVSPSTRKIADNCNTSNNIEVENRRSGTAGKPLCQECKGLA